MNINISDKKQISLSLLKDVDNNFFQLSVTTTGQSGDEEKIAYK